VCGIAGVVDAAGLAPQWRDDLRELDASIRHRGPDDHGYITDVDRTEVPLKLGANKGTVETPRVLFVHRRLSILDLSEAARQPLSRAGGAVFITYNGEIYNFRELRAELAREGAEFRTQSDTEVVLELYRRRGIEDVARLRGIFAFAIADVTKGKVFLVRDHFGVKPLYYARVGSRFVFSSELKSFRGVHGFRAVIDPEAIQTFLHFLWIPGERTGLAGVRKLSPGCWMEIDLATNETLIRQYWSPLDRALSRENEGTVAENVRFLRDELGRIVKQQMVSDVPLGAFLSGGLDSSLIVALMKDATGRAPSTYSVGYAPQDLAYDIVPDDLPFARQVSRDFETRNTEIVLSPDVATLLPTVVETLDEPIGDPAAISSYLICQAAKQTLTVMLSGMGGDEVFAGYPRQRALAYGRMYRRLPPWARRGIKTVVARLPAAGRSGAAKLGRAGKKFLTSVEASPLEHYIAMETYFDDGLRRELTSPDGPLAEHNDVVARDVAALVARVQIAAGEDPLRQAMMWDLVTYLPNLNLAYTDRTSMAHAVEVRVPFLDVDLVEWSFGLRSRDLVRVRRGKLAGKWLLKRAAETVLPAPIVWRPKAGFGAPIRSWLRSELTDMREELLGPHGLGARGWFESRVIRRLKDEFLTGVSDYALQLWMLMSLELWSRRFLD